MLDADVVLLATVHSMTHTHARRAANRAGARVFTTVSTDEKARLSKEAGADEVIRYTQEDFKDAVRRMTDGKGVRVVYDSVGKDTFEKSLDCLAARGLLALFGQSSGAVAPFDAQVLAAKGSLFFTRPTLGHYIATRDELLARANDVLAWIADGSLKIRIGATSATAAKSLLTKSMDFDHVQVPPNCSPRVKRRLSWTCMEW